MATQQSVWRILADFSQAINEGKKVSSTFKGIGDQSKVAGDKSGSFATRMGKSLGSVQQKMNRTGKAMTVGVTLPIVVGVGAAVKTFANFETSIVAAGSKAGATSAEIEEMKDVALEWGQKTKYSATESAEAMDRMAAAGFNARDTIDALPGVMKAAQASGEDLALTGDVVAKALNAFNLEATDATRVADVFAQAANTSALDMEGMADALAHAGQLGASAGQDLEDVVAIVSRLVDMGVPAASAGTAVRQAVQTMAAPTEKAAKIIGDMGMSFRDASGEMKPMPDLIREVEKGLDDSNPKFLEQREAAGMSEQAYRDWALSAMFGREGMKAVQLAMSEGKPVMIDLANETEKLDQLQRGLAETMGEEGAAAFIKAHTSGGKFVATGADAVEALGALNRASEGTSDKIAGMFQQTTAQKLDNLKGSFETLSIVLIDTVAPALNDVVQKMADLVESFSDFAGAHPTLVKVAAGFLVLLAATGPALVGVSKLITALQVIVKVLPFVTAGFARMSAAMTANPVGVIIVAIAALVAGLIWFFTQTKIGQQIVQVAWAAIKNAVAAVVTWFQTSAMPVIKTVFAAIGAAAVWLKDKFVIAWNAIKTGAQAVWTALTTAFTAIVNAAKWLWSGISAAVNAINNVFASIGRVISSIWTGYISPIFQLIGAIVKWLAVTVFKANVAIIQHVWRTLGAVFQAVYATVIQPIIGFFKRAIEGWKILIAAAIRLVQRIWQTLGNVWRAVYAAHLKPIVDAFKSLISGLRSVISTVISKIREYWSGLGAAFRSVYNKNLKPIIDVFKAGIGKLKDAFRTAVDGIKAQWNRIEAIGKAPVKFIIETVLNNGLIKGFNTLADIFDTDHIKDIPLPKGFRAGGPIDGTFSPRRRDNQLIRAEAGEWMINRRSTKRMEQKYPGYLKHINATGSLPGYRDGGQVAPVPGRGNRHSSGYPWATWAGDYPQPMGTPVKAWKSGLVSAVKHLTTSYGKHVRMNHDDGSSSLYAHLSRIAVAVGQRLGKGDRVGNVGSTGNSSGPHLHFETMAGAFNAAMGKAGGVVSSALDFLKGLSPFEWIKDKVSGAMKGLSAVGNNKFGELVGGMPGFLLGKAKDWLTSKLTGGEDPGGEGVARWGSTVMKALGIAGLPQTGAYKNAWLRQIESESGGNPNIRQGVTDVNSGGNEAMGLVQVIPSTFAAFRDKNLPNDRRNPLANLVAGMNWAKYRYPNMLSVIGHGHGYARGTSWANGIANVAEEGAELVVDPSVKRFRSGSKVFDSRDTYKILSRMAAGQSPVPNRAGTATTSVSRGAVKVDNRSVEFNMPIYYPRAEEIPTMAAQRQLVRVAQQRVFGRGDE